jgi:predicted SprT family Zn-dependent metalloprotease
MDGKLFAIRDDRSEGDIARVFDGSRQADGRFDYTLFCCAVTRLEKQKSPNEMVGEKVRCRGCGKEYKIIKAKES